ncbi:Methylmalonyl-CoA mutase (plasmid) [Roseovarius sp. THAF8]|uniref:acyl-CoA mutase large subunit family protein n=1 Tax=Roseovarius sp. THAF8 TaxID=2587846 RepID=UPI001268F47E|nr:acyl-CoA mutase large subunit family protein [Roseovarius sp. THAF8]QFT99896.1 Methylmalonyl-CoA mutase [Roseovarius sp. THAF8]
MSSKTLKDNGSDLAAKQADWQNRYDKEIGEHRTVVNRSGIEVRPLYTPLDWSENRYEEDVGLPGEPPYTRGIYSTMHRGRTWTQRQLIGLGTPQDYNKRVRMLLQQGASAISLLPCNSGFRGIDCDESPVPLLGTCGTVINTVEHMEAALDGVPIDEISTAMNDPTPFTLFAFLIGVAKRRGVPLDKITGTANQSDYISHFVANHMFYRLSQPGARRVFVDHVRFCRENVPNWNPVSIVGQHMQQAGATPAETVGLTLSTAIQYAEDCIAAGMHPDNILPRFTYFFDISISFFEEVAKFRAGRRIWAHIARDRLGAKDPRSWRFKFHGQTSGVDLTQQQPLNNIARVTAQAIAGIFGGLQSMHTDGFDEAMACPTEDAARIAVATQNILREEAHLCDVIDPLGGSYYVESLTNEMEEEILKVMGVIENAGGMYKAADAGIVQRMIGKSALSYQNRIESGTEKVVGVNCYKSEIEDGEVETYRPNRSAMEAQVAAFKAFKASRSQRAVDKSLNELARAANGSENVYEKVVEAVDCGVTHGEIISCLRGELGFGHPLMVA